MLSRDFPAVGKFKQSLSLLLSNQQHSTPSRAEKNILLSYWVPCRPSRSKPQWALEHLEGGSHVILTKVRLTPAISRLKFVFLIFVNIFWDLNVYKN